MLNNLEYLYEHLPSRFRRDDKDLFLKRYLQFVGETLDDYDQKFDGFFQNINPATASEEWIEFWLRELFGWSWFPKWFTLFEKRRLYKNFTAHLARRGTKRGLELWLADFNIQADVYVEPLFYGDFVWGEGAIYAAEPLLIVIELRAATPNFISEMSAVSDGAWGESFYANYSPLFTKQEINSLLRFMQPHAQEILIIQKEVKEISISLPQLNFVTPDIISGGVMRVRAKEIKGKSDGDAISQWNNIIQGASVHATNETFSQQPLYKFVGGDPVVRFDGSNDCLSFGDNFDLGNNSMSIFAVISRATMNGTVIGKTADLSVLGRWSLGSLFGGNGGIYQIVNEENEEVVLNLTPITPRTDFSLWEMHLDRTVGTMTFYVDGHLIDTAFFTPDAQANINNSSILTIGRYGSTAGYYFNGDIKEIFLAQSASPISGAELVNLRNYFQVEHKLTGF